MFSATVRSLARICSWKDHADARLARVVRAADVEGLAGQANFAGIHRVYAVENFHQRGLARAVFADKRMYFMRPKGESNIGKNAVPPKRLDDAGHCEQRFGHSLFYVLLDGRIEQFLHGGVLQIRGCD